MDSIELLEEKCSYIFLKDIFWVREWKIKWKIKWLLGSNKVLAGLNIEYLFIYKYHEFEKFCVGENSSRKQEGLNAEMS